MEESYITDETIEDLDLRDKLVKNITKNVSRIVTDSIDDKRSFSILSSKDDSKDVQIELKRKIRLTVNNVLKEYIKEKESQIEDLENKIKGREIIISEDFESIDKLAKNVVDLDRKKDEKKKEIDKLEKTGKRWKKAIKKSKKRKGELEKEIRTQEKKEEDLIEEINEFKKDLNALEKEREKLKPKIEELKKEKEKLANQVESKKEESKVLTEKIEDKKEDREIIDELLDGKKKERNRLNMKIDSLQKDEQSLNNKIDELEGDLHALEKEKEKLKPKIDKLKKEREKLANQVESKEEKRERLTMEIEKNDEILRDLKDSLKESRDELEEKKRRKNELVETIKDLQQDKKKLTEDKKELNKELKNLNQEREKLKPKINELRKEKTEIEEEKEEKSEDLNQIIGELNKKKEELEKNKEELKEKEATFNNLQRDISEMKDRIDKLKQQNRELKEQVKQECQKFRKVVSNKNFINILENKNMFEYEQYLKYYPVKNNEVNLSNMLKNQYIEDGDEIKVFPSKLPNIMTDFISNFSEEIIVDERAEYPEYLDNKTIREIEDMENEISAYMDKELKNTGGYMFSIFWHSLFLIFFNSYIHESNSDEGFKKEFVSAVIYYYKEVIKKDIHENEMYTQGLKKIFDDRRINNINSIDKTYLPALNNQLEKILFKLENEYLNNDNWENIRDKNLKENIALLEKAKEKYGQNDILRVVFNSFIAEGKKLEQDQDSEAKIIVYLIFSSSLLLFEKNYYRGDQR